MSSKQFKATWPRVIRSTEVDDDAILAIDGANFEDGMRRIVVGVGMPGDGMSLIEETLRQIDFADQQRSWFETMLNATPGSGDPS